MLSTVVTELEKTFGRSYVVAVFFPLFFFVALSLALGLELGPGLGEALDDYEAWSTFVQGVLLLASLLLIAALAYVLTSLQYTIVRLFEGYWPAALGPLRAAGVRAHQARVDYLRVRAEAHGARIAWATGLIRRLGRKADPSDEERRALKLAREVRDSDIGPFQDLAQLDATEYPSPPYRGYLMPTRLGNILRGAETYPDERYGMDAVLLWSRLQSYVHDKRATAVETSRMALDYLVLMTLLLALVPPGWLLAITIWGERWELFVPAAGVWLLTLVAYRAACQAAVAYGENVKATFDLDRHELAKALKITIPADEVAERNVWDEMTAFLARNEPREEAKPQAPSPTPQEEFFKALTTKLESVDLAECCRALGSERVSGGRKGNRERD